MKNKIRPLAGIMVLAAFALPARIKSLFGANLISAANDTYDAAVEVHECSVTRTNDVAITARHLLWTQGAAAGGVKLATASLPALGTIDNIETGTALRQSVLLLGKGDTKKVVANAAISQGAPVYQAAAGKVAPAGVLCIGTALTAAAADDDIIELDDNAPVACGSRTLTAATTLTAADNGATFFLGTAGGFDITLPPLATAPFHCEFVVLVAPTTAYTLTGATADKIVGHVLSASGAAEDTETTAGGDVVNFVASTAVIGDRVTLDMDGTLYLVNGKCAAAGGITITG